MDIVKQVVKSIVGLGYHPPDVLGIKPEHAKPQHYPVLFGTGFSPERDYVVTNAHVLKEMLKTREVKIDGTLTPLQINNLGIIHLNLTESGRRWIEKRPLKGCTVTESPPQSPIKIDLAVIQFDSVRKDKDIPPIELETSPPEIGEEVGMIGYPFGGSLFFHGSSIQCSAGPSFQKGCISNLGVFGNPPAVTSIQTDISVSGGSSGSPLINLSNGHVYGMLWGGPQFQGDAGPFIHASPFSWFIPAWMIKAAVEKSKHAITRASAEIPSKFFVLVNDKEFLEECDIESHSIQTDNVSNYSFFLKDEL